MNIRMGVVFCVGALAGGLAMVAATQARRPSVQAAPPETDPIVGNRGGWWGPGAAPQEEPASPEQGADPPAATDVLPRFSESARGVFIPGGGWPEDVAEAARPEAVHEALARADATCGSTVVRAEGVDCASYPCLLAVSGRAPFEERWADSFRGLCTFEPSMLSVRRMVAHGDEMGFEYIFAVVDPEIPLPKGPETDLGLEARMTEFKALVLPSGKAGR